MIPNGAPCPTYGSVSDTDLFTPSATTPWAFEPSSATAEESVTLTLPLDIAHVANHTRQKVFLSKCVLCFSKTVHIFNWQVLATSEGAAT